MNSGVGRLARGMVLGLAATALAAGAAQAQDNAAANRMLGGVSAEEIISILTENQIQSQLEAGSSDPWINAKLPSGLTFFVRLQGCQNGVNCQVIQYGAAFTGPDLPVSDFNTFNGRYAFGKTYKTDKNEMFIEHAVTVAGGIRRGAIEVNMMVFLNMVHRFAQFIMERMNTVTASLDKSKSGAITNQGGPLPAGSALAAFREAAKKHPEIINRVQPGKPLQPAKTR